MKDFYIYTVAENKIVGRVMAKDWVDARIAACDVWHYRFDEVFATEKPLPVI